MKIIAFFGQMASGKDTAADYVITKLSKNWTRVAFGDAVKNVFASNFGVSREFIELWKRNPEPPPGFLKNIRQSLQFIGDGFRQVKGEIWLELGLKDNGFNLIVSDGRYINEGKEVRSKKGINCVLCRPGFENDDPNPSESQIKVIADFCKNYLQEGPIPPYEVLLDSWGDKVPEGVQYYDYFLINDGNVADLFTKLDEAFIPFIEKFYDE